MLDGTRADVLVRGRWLHDGQLRARGDGRDEFARAIRRAADGGDVRRHGCACVLQSATQISEAFGSVIGKRVAT